MPTNAPAHVIPVRVYYEDTDAGGVVYYANYLRYFERARTEMLRACGIQQDRWLTESRIGFVVRHIETDYRASARLDDELTVTATIEKLGGASVDFAQRALRGDTVLATARVRVACVDFARHRPTPIPAPIVAALSAYVAADATSSP
jgi:acyl-CoA thioester hydrolase